MVRIELINAMRMIKDHCETIEYCEQCPIYKDCVNNIQSVGALPEGWEIGETE